MQRGGQVYYYHKDALGSVTALTDVNGQVAQTYEYDSFGNITNQTGNIENPFTYTGREYDPETGNYYYRARYYDARAGRFINEDPIGFWGGINLFGYVRNNPINYLDSYGYFGWWGAIGGGIGGAIGGGFAGYIGSCGQSSGTIGGVIGGGIAGFIGGGLGTTTGAVWGAIGGAGSAALNGQGTAGVIGAAIGGGLGGAFGGAMSNFAGVGALGQALGGGEGAWAGSVWGTAFGMLGDGIFGNAGKCPCK